MIKNALVYGEDHTFSKKNIIFLQDRILMIQDYEWKDEDYPSAYDADGLYAIPGLIDIHMHGAAGIDICGAAGGGISRIAEYEARNGVTTFVPTTMSLTEDELNPVMDRIKEYMMTDHLTRGTKSNPYGVGAHVAGINMEGPFVNPGRCGAQDTNKLMLPDKDMFDRLWERSGGNIKFLDMAPELDGAIEFITDVSKKTNISLAHTNSDYDIAKRAFDAGANHVTHLYNAMPGISHRNPGPIIAAKEAHARVELIADGIHVDPAMVRFTFDTFEKDKVILISDSSEATGKEEGEYCLGGQPITVKGNRATLLNDPNVIAGSVTNLYECMKKAVLEMGISLEDAVRAATENPAKAIGIFDDRGSLEKDKCADIVLLDKDLNIVDVWVRGSRIKR